MIERLSDKQKPCTYCTQYGHTAWKCPRKPRKAMQAKQPMARGTSRLKTTKPIARRGKVAKQWTKTRTDFVKTLDASKLQVCHYCQQLIPMSAVEIDHKESRGRRPDLRNDLTNLVVSCHFCNSQKGSKSHDEIPHVCDIQHT